jgi:hypothetical protein
MGMHQPRNPFRGHRLIDLRHVQEHVQNGGKTII